MHILLSNDDGYLATGLMALYQALSKIATVTVVAPTQNHSGASNALTLQRPLHVHQLKEGAMQGFYIVDGTPTDCVHLALTGLLDAPPDLVVSGINQGANLAEDVIYSGTVAAAIEGYLFGIPAVAFSQVARGWPNIDASAQIACDWLQYMETHALMQHCRLWNVNMPAVPYSEHAGFKFSRLGTRHPSQAMIKQSNPRGEPVYWIGAAGEPKDQSSDTDFHAVQAGFTAVTPLHLELTDYRTLNVLKSIQS